MGKLMVLRVRLSNRNVVVKINVLVEPISNVKMVKM
jgi:hypothetical protein